MMASSLRAAAASPSAVPMLRLISSRPAASAAAVRFSSLASAAPAGRGRVVLCKSAPRFAPWPCVRVNALFSSAAAQVNISDGEANAAIGDTTNNAEDSSSSSDQQEDESADSATASANTESADESFEGIPPEEVIRTGFCKYINQQNGYAVFLQDAKFRAIGTGGTRVRKVHIPFRRFDPEIYWDLRRFGAADLMQPFIRVGDARRFQFQARPPEKGPDMRGCNLRYEGGGAVPMIHWRDAPAVMRKARARLGHEVYNILSAAAEKDERELAQEVTEAIEKCDRRVKWARKQVADPKRVERDCKTKLGCEVYDLLSNIATVDDVERRVDEAYMKCLKDLSALELTSTADNGDGDEEEGKE